MKLISTALSLATIPLLASTQSLSVTTTRFDGNGCHQGSATTVSVTADGVSYTPPLSFSAPTPATNTLGNSRWCQAQIFADVPKGWKFRFAQTTSRVNVGAEAGSPYEVSNYYFFSKDGKTIAQSAGRTELTNTGPATVINTYTPDDVWSTCGGKTVVNINTYLHARGRGPGSITIAGSIDTPIVWEKC